MRPRYQVALVLIVALGLRLIMLDSRALWYDEAFAVLFSEKGLNAMLYGTLTTAVSGATGSAAADVHPLLYYVTLNGWMSVFGQSAAWVRLYSVIVSLITLLVLYWLARELFDHRTGVIALVLAACSPFYVQYSTEARMYSLLALWLMLATWCYVRGNSPHAGTVKTLPHPLTPYPEYGEGEPEVRAAMVRRILWGIGFAVCAALAMYTQQLAGFYLVALGLAAILSRKRAIIGWMVLASAGAILIYLPWLVQLPAQFGKIGAYWIAQPGIAQLILTFRTFLFVDMDASSALAGIAGLIAAIIVIIFLMLRAIPILRRPNRNHDSVALVLWLMVAPIAGMWIVSQVRPVYLNRALLPSGLMLLLAVAWLFGRARLPGVIVGGLAVIVGVSFVVGLGEFYSWQTFPRGRFVEGIAVTARIPETRVIHANKITALPFAYYDRSETQNARYIADPPGSPSDTLAAPTQKVLGWYADACINDAARGAGQVWYVIFDRQGEADLPWLRARFQAETRTRLNDLSLYLFAGLRADAGEAAPCP